mgnify:CR=1 FL=1
MNQKRRTVLKSTGAMATLLSLVIGVPLGDFEHGYTNSVAGLSDDATRQQPGGFGGQPGLRTPLRPDAAGIVGKPCIRRLSQAS